MKFKFQLSVVSLAAAVIALAGAASASAQDINFTCGTGTYPASTAAYISLNGVSGNACPGNGVAVPGKDNQGVLNNYTLGNVSITSTGYQYYNTFQGDITQGGVGQGPGGPAVPPSPEPSLSIYGGNQDSLTLTESSGSGFFKFASVDLRTLDAGTLTYSITGYDTLLPVGQRQVFEIFNEPNVNGCGAGDLGNGVCISTPTVNIGGTNYVEYITVDSKTNTYNYSGDEINELVITTFEPNGDYGYLDLLDLPEGGEASMYLLLAGAVCCGAMFFRRRAQVTA
jgi:hypothetical protein